MSADFKPVLMGTVGLGNFAGAVCRFLQNYSRLPQPPIKLLAVCEPDHQLHAQTIERLRAEGMTVLRNFDDLLALPIEAVWLPLPIDLHRPFAEKALAAGKAVMTEKPAAGCLQDVDAMIAARDRYKLPLTVGFQWTYQPQVATLKRAILQGDLGQIRSVTVHGCSPRTDQYYARSPWSGKIQRQGVWILDSVAQNAHAHCVNLGLFLAGPRMELSAQPLSIQAELYRANPIENYDTVAMRLPLETGATLLVHLTHACSQRYDRVLEIQGTRGRAFHVNGTVVIESSKGQQVIAGSAEDRLPMVDAFARLVRGQAPADRCIATMEVARMHVLTINAASQATPVINVPESHIQPVTLTNGVARGIKNLEPFSRLCVARNQLLHESGLFPWTRKPGELDLRHYQKFDGLCPG